MLLIPETVVNKHKYQVYPVKSSLWSIDLLTRILTKSVLFSKIIYDFTFTFLFSTFSFLTKNIISMIKIRIKSNVVFNREKLTLLKNSKMLSK